MGNQPLSYLVGRMLDVEGGITMQFIPKNVHVETPHTSGAAVIRNGNIDK